MLMNPNAKQFSLRRLKNGFLYAATDTIAQAALLIDLLVKPFVQRAEGHDAKFTAYQAAVTAYSGSRYKANSTSCQTKAGLFAVVFSKLLPQLLHDVAVY